MIIEKYKTIFVHIPKNAGTSVETLFKTNTHAWDERLFNRHDTIHDIKSKLEINDDFRKNERYSEYSKFAIVRNPYDRMVSWYFFYNIRNLTLHAEDTSFNAFIKDPLVFNLFENTKLLYNPQHTWVDDTVTILKYENLKKELNELFGMEIDLPTVNKTKHKHYLDYYNQELLDIVYNKYKQDFEKFNYKKL